MCQYKHNFLRDSFEAHVSSSEIMGIQNKVIDRQAVTLVIDGYVTKCPVFLSGRTLTANCLLLNTLARFPNLWVRYPSEANLENRVRLVPSDITPHRPTCKRDRPSARLCPVCNTLSGRKNQGRIKQRRFCFFYYFALSPLLSRAAQAIYWSAQVFYFSSLWEATLENPCLQHSKVLVLLLISVLTSVLTVSFFFPF